MAIDITTEKQGNALVVIFSRPERGNALGFDMIAQLFNTLKPAFTDRAIRAIMFRGQGGNFMDGLDMDLYSGDFTSALERVNQMFQPYHSVIRELQIMDKPTLAAVEGMTTGPGLSLMMACDFVIAARNTKFNTQFASYGMTPHGGITYALARKIGAAKAYELLMLSEDFTAEQAQSWGLVNKVVDPDKLQEESLAWLEKLSNGPTRAYAGIKKLVMKAFDQDLNTQLSLEHTYWGASARSFDFKEAIKAHFAKRPGKFTGT